MSEIADRIGLLRHPDAGVRRDAALVLGDWLYPRHGMTPDETRTVHQALMDAALAESDAAARVDQLDALLRSTPPRLGVTGWAALAQAQYDFDSEGRDLALALIAISGDEEAERIASGGAD